MTALLIYLGPDYTMSIMADSGNGSDINYSVVFVYWGFYILVLWKFCWDNLFFLDQPKSSHQLDIHYTELIYLII